ncbi:MAG: flavodoxin family protein [Christensenellaceae bacterium]|jgi:multimeric flavodoxin WrbA|nr:flavodoxin family protein [Christensenellaceae bacterium]
MKVLLLNGSPHRSGCTATALKEIEQQLAQEGIDTETYHLGSQPLRSCLSCRLCATLGKCTITSDGVNDFIDMAARSDAFIFGSPVHYASATGAITTFLDRAFFAGSWAFRFKPGAAIVSARRAGTTAALDQLNKYFLFNNMPLIPSQYWNMVHGSVAADVAADAEGLQIMRTLARNAVWLLKALAVAKENGIDHPTLEEPRMRTNFIR